MSLALVRKPLRSALVIGGLEKHPEEFRTVVCSTGQHREMLDQVLTLFAIKPSIQLDLMRDNQGLAELTARLIASLDEVLEAVKPDCVLARAIPPVSWQALSRHSTVTSHLAM